MAAPDGYCQGHGYKQFSRPAVPYLCYRAYWYFRIDGAARTFRKLVRFLELLLMRKLGRPVKARAPRVQVDETLGLQPGDWVRVKSRDEICATLDEFRKYKGLAFMPGMFRACGRRFRVFKRVERILFEESGSRRAMNHTVLLEGSICDGEGVGCDRSCFYFWREAWLERSQDEHTDAALEP